MPLATRPSHSRLPSYARDGAENETEAEVQRLERDALVVSMHTLLVGLRHRERKNTVRFDAEPAEARAVGDAGAQIWNDRNLRIDLVSRHRDRREHRRSGIGGGRFFASLSHLDADA